MWLESQVALKELLAQELPATPPRPERDRAAFSQGLATLFLRYVQVVRRLETCHDQMLQPQKRRMLRRVLDGALGRVLELKEALVQLDRSEYHFMDHVLQDLKLTPGRLRARFMGDIRRDEERERLARESGAKELDREQAAIRIQKVGAAPCPGDLTGRFPEYPDEDVGGSSILFAEKTPEQRGVGRGAHGVRAGGQAGGPHGGLWPPSLPALWELGSCRGLGTPVQQGHAGGPQVREELEQLEREEGDKKKKKKKKKEEKEKAKKGKKKDKKPEEAESLMLPPSKFLPIISTGFTQYQATWGERDVGKPVQQGCNLELIKAQMRKEVEKEVRLQVDEMMRQELQRLRLAVDREEPRPLKAKKSSKKLGKKSGKKEKDLTQDRTLDSLYEELVLQGILKKPQAVPLADYTGDFSYLGSTLRAAGAEPAPSVLDVRQNVVLYAILRLGSPTVHELAPQVRSLLLAGPAGTGEQMLVHAVCTETGANLFDLSPENLVDKYPGKAGLSLLMHMVFKVARLLQPSVIWVGNAEKTFYKKVPKEEKEAEPKRLRKELPKALKMLRVDDRVLLLGTSDRPYMADAKALCKAYERVLLVPRPDYASRYVTWQRLIQKHGGTVGRGLDLSALATVSDGYSQGPMAQVVRAVLTERRILQLPRRPLRAEEFLQLLPKADPVYPEEERTLQDWYLKTPLGKRWLKATEEQVEGKEMQGKKKKGRK
ncbi:IQ and AAA domain-containing protein 1-like [Alligator sinensis]|uniref:IQ and AAA domain-containing protein 1-like n=1 Tax=Alligator sinensis TaxID=38654 RepID=A0A3Q0FPV0_ALLSI|nr:IQ and AAA domain-containing protein 1-like [Alligator sinensis]